MRYIEARMGASSFPKSRYLPIVHLLGAVSIIQAIVILVLILLLKVG